MKLKIKRITLTILLSLLGVVFAHSELESSNPQDGAILESAPKQVVLTFGEEAQLDFSIFKVYPLPLSPEAIVILEAEPVGETMILETAEHSDTEHGEGEHADTDHSDAEHTDTDHSDANHSDTEHVDTDHHKSEASSHELMDSAAEEFIPMILELDNDEADRLDTGIVETANSATVTLNLKDTLASGAYVVMWRVLSVDTHTVQGYSTFFIK